MRMASRLPLAAQLKGVSWSKEGGPIGHLTRWCKEVGAKLINENISTDQNYRQRNGSCGS